MTYCENCGERIERPSDRYCSHCRKHNPYNIENGEMLQIKRPKGISILSIMLIANGILSIIGAMGFGLIGIAYIIFGIGLWSGKSWARTGSIILTIIGIAINTILLMMVLASAVFEYDSIMLSSVTLISSIFAIGVLINMIVIYYLYKPNVRAFFKINKK